MYGQSVPTTPGLPLLLIAILAIRPREAMIETVEPKNPSF
jgi:hypothetical protein